MSDDSISSRVAVVGGGMAGAACASALMRAGMQVTLFDKSRGVGGRLSTRRVRWADADGVERHADIDHGAQHFGARHPRFRAAMARAEAAGCVARWRPLVHAARPTAAGRDSHVAVPTMPALCSHLLAGVPLRLEQPVQRLQRDTAGWHVVTLGGHTTGPFDQVMLALPPAQAAVLVAGHQDRWADDLAAFEMAPCWTLMAVTDEVDWPWDAAEPDSGPLAWVARNDRKPGRSTAPGLATWVAQAGADWSARHLEADSQAVADALQAALGRLMPGSRPVRWHHASAHRWRYAVPGVPAPDSREFWWDAGLGLGVCGDFLAGGQVEGAWRSGDELADTVIAALEAVEQAVDFVA